MTVQLKEVKNFFELLNKNNVEYMIIGGVAVNVHGYTRATGDLDIWYNPTEVNYRKLLTTIQEFGFDTSEIESLASDPLKAFIRLPLESFYVELLAIIDGRLDYNEVYSRTYNFNITEELSVKVIGYDDLIQNKIMARRVKDLDDIAQLERRRNKQN
jgi:predicted nucleotidyltransferase